jgi:hypothetical protein
VLTWVLGALFLLGGVWIVQNLQLDAGVGEFQYGIALVVALVLFLMTGLCWISVAVATRQDMG